MIPASPGRAAGAHGKPRQPRGTTRWRGVGAMTVAWARTNRREDAPATRLPPTLLAKLFHSMS